MFRVSGLGLEPRTAGLCMLQCLEGVCHCNCNCKRMMLRHVGSCNNDGPSLGAPLCNAT